MEAERRKLLKGAKKVTKKATKTAKKAQKATAKKSTAKESRVHTPPSKGIRGLLPAPKYIFTEGQKTIWMSNLGLPKAQREKAVLIF